jgi:hypothetical protein
LPKVIQPEILQHETKGWSVMNRKAVQQGESIGRIRKNLQEIHEDEIMHAWMEAQTADISENADDQWIDWKEIERHVLRLQRQLAHAVEHNNRKAVRHYKWLIRKSHHTKLLAIRHVTQENRGRRTPGVDGLTYTTSERRRELANLVNLRNRPLPVRRVYPQEERKTQTARYTFYSRQGMSGHSQDGYGTRMGYSVFTQYVWIPTRAVNMGRHESGIR